MNAEQRDAVLRMVVSARQPGLDRDGFVASTGVRDPETWALGELKDALVTKSSEDVELAMLLGARFGMSGHWVEPLISVLTAEWTNSHEDAAESLGELADERSVPALKRAAMWVPAYLDYDEGRALAKKAIYALGKIPGSEAALALDDLRLHEDRPLREWVASVIEHRNYPHG